MSPSTVNVTSGFVTIAKPCMWHSFHPLSQDLFVQLPLVKEEKRSVGLDVFMDADKFSLIVSKKHRSIVNEVLFPELPEEVEESSWKCFGSNEEVNEANVVPVKKEPKAQKEIVDKDKKKNQVVKLTIFTPSSISTKHYKVFPSKTTEKRPAFSKDQQEFDAIASSSLPLDIDTSVPPPSFLTPPTSGPASPAFISEKPSFAFNLGVINAPNAGVKIAKKKLSDNGDTFEMYVDHSRPKKIRVFSPEEVKKQEVLVNEWKRKIQDCL
ncbi:hypothetical protein CRE_04219 [Caenorhabditis remanei]|uniref:Uncharacterized protein n=1 Tax=Caenorhabditis remanei TaxID=31234 RepID=E3MYS4_CAERE|nr:hypothetical protein CRE_04219 [Caenorhabditis remanei]